MNMWQGNMQMKLSCAYFRLLQIAAYIDIELFFSALKKYEIWNLYSKSWFVLSYKFFFQYIGFELLSFQLYRLIVMIDITSRCTMFITRWLSRLLKTSYSTAHARIFRYKSVIFEKDVSPLVFRCVTTGKYPCPHYFVMRCTCVVRPWCFFSPLNRIDRQDLKSTTLERRIYIIAVMIGSNCQAMDRSPSVACRSLLVFAMRSFPTLKEDIVWKHSSFDWMKLKYLVPSNWERMNAASQKTVSICESWQL